MNKKQLEHQRGQALIIIVGAIIGMIAIVALAVDGGNAFSDRRHAQNAADTAALASALAKVSEQDWLAAGMDRAASNGYINDGIRSTVTINNPPSASDCNPTGSVSPYVGDDEYIQVIILSHLDTYFAPVIGVDQVHNCVEAIARAKPAVTAPIVLGNAMVSLNQHDCKAFYVQGNAIGTVTGSGVFVNSDCSSGAFQAFDASGSSLLTAPGICVVGGATYATGHVIPPPQPNCGEQLPYPPEYIWPTPTCSSVATQSGGIITPGSIPATWISGTVTLQPGIYCISGDLKVNAHDHITGHGVLLYFIDGGIKFNGNGVLDLSAPTTGDYAGLLIYLPLTNSSDVEILGSSLNSYAGTILAPASNFTITGDGSAAAINSQIIANTITLIGGSNITVHYDDNSNYDITLPPSIEITE